MNLQRRSVTNIAVVNPEQRGVVTPVEVNDVKPKITSFRLLRTSFFYQTKEFFNNSTLHGVRYIAETERPFGERFMWFCFTVFGLISALVIIVSLWEKFQTNPTITGLDMDVHNQQLVFPTIVVCPLESYDSGRLDGIEYTGNDNEESAEAIEPFLKLLPQLSYASIRSTVAFSNNISWSGNYVKLVNSINLRSNAFKMNILCNETFDTCKYRDEAITCCDHFHPVYSEHGFCFAFNPQFIDEANSETYNQNFHELFETDKKWALFFAPKREAQIFVHSHLENFGWDFRPHVIWQPDFAAELLISMKQTYTTEDARQLSIGQRKCIFPEEFKLQYYEGNYTFTSCMKECRIRRCMKFCSCIPPFYRQFDNTKYCNMTGLQCIANNMTSILDVRSCHECELSCTNTVYEVEKLTKTTADPSKTADTFVNIEFLTWPIIRYKREVLFGWVDLLVSFGGIAGLFLGFSLLSGVEIVYYFTLRTCCMLYKNRGELYEIEEKKMNKPLEMIDLSLTLRKRSSKSEHGANGQPSVRQIEVAGHSDRRKSLSDSLPNDTIVPSIMGRTMHMTRVAKKKQSIRNLLQMNANATSYDYANRSEPFYMP